MRHLVAQCCTTGTFTPLTPAAACRMPFSAAKCQNSSRPSSLAWPNSRRVSNSRREVRMCAWTQVIDQASGKPYYWNTDTNETAWEMPSAAGAAAAAVTTVAEPSTQPTTTTSSSSSSSGSTQDHETDSMSNDALFDALAAAYGSDGSGMEFWEVARAHRKYGVFEPPYFDYLDQRQKAAGDEAERELAFKMMCKLS